MAAGWLVWQKPRDLAVIQRALEIERELDGGRELEGPRDLFEQDADLPAPNKLREVEALRDTA
jgi:hypothetical protein